MGTTTPGESRAWNWRICSDKGKDEKKKKKKKKDFQKKKKKKKKRTSKKKKKKKKSWHASLCEKSK